MLERGFIKHRQSEKAKHHQIVILFSNVLLYLGVLIIIVSFGYLFFNLNKSDYLIGIMLPIFLAGLGLILVSQLIKRAYSKLRR